MFSSMLLVRACSFGLAMVTKPGGVASTTLIT
jgi:hypothetical protein